MPLCIIVEDHEDTRDGYAEYLKGDGFEVLTAGSRSFTLAEILSPLRSGWPLTPMRAPPRMRA